MKRLFSILFALVLAVSLGLATATLVMADSKEVTPGWTNIEQVAAGVAHTVGVKNDGTVVAVGYNDDGQCDVSSWSDIDQVTAGEEHTVGLKSDNTVVAIGSNDDGQCEVSSWSDIDQVAAGGFHTVGLRSDSTLVAAGDCTLGRCDVSGWTNITQVAAGGLHTVGLRADGTVVAVGSNADGQCDVGGWTDITQVAAGDSHTVGVQSDGTVVAEGYNDYGQCDVGEWTDVIQVAAGGAHTVGLKSDGTVIAVGNNGDGQCDVGTWTNIDQVAAGRDHTVGVTSSGIVVAVGNNDIGQCGEGVLQTIDGEGTINAIIEADVEVIVNGVATVIVFKYEDNPHPDAPIGGGLTSLDLLQDGDLVPLDMWREIYPIEYGSGTQTEVRFYYKQSDLDAANIDDENTVALLWHNGNPLDPWVVCSPGGRNTTDQEKEGIQYSGYMYAIIQENGTTPTLGQITPDTFGGYGHPSETNGACGMATLADVTPFALVLVGIVAVWATKRKGKVL